MKRVLALSACFAAASVLFLCRPAGAKDPSPPPKTSVQIAILLDTSNSMDGLIDQAKTQLWNVVNEFLRARRDGRTPAIQVALFEYGKNSLPSNEGYVRLILPLTDDLDKVSEELFALKTNGGDEYCGWVIKDAVNRLNWARSGDVYKAIFIAGNEPFTQGPVNFQTSCRAAIERGIIVNTIFCGSNAEGGQTGWKDGAVLADGRYMSIDQNLKVVEIPAPQDKEISRLGVELNKTYLPFGKMGQEALARQSAQDANALSISTAALVNRSNSKSNATLYCNDAWDLVDAIKNGKCKIEDVKDDELPAELRKLDKAGRKAKVAEATKQREQIQTQIVKLNGEREKFLAAERKKQLGANQDTLDKAIVKAIRDQATRHHFTFE
jgi:hypothetical protein